MVTSFKRTYARRLSEFTEGGRTEEWYQTCRRVIEEMFDIQKRHVHALGLEWNDQKAQRTAKDAYERLFMLKWTPPGRGLWMMGASLFMNERALAFSIVLFAQPVRSHLKVDIFLHG